MKLTEAKIKEAQVVIEAVMNECKLDSLEFYPGRNNVAVIGDDILGFPFIFNLYINRLYELDNKAHGTNHTPPPF